jgi:hypothetical protein
MRIKTVQMIEEGDWSDLVSKTYGRPYQFQQQDGCQDRGTVDITVPDEETNDEGMAEEIPEILNGEEMGVKFAVWLARDPKLMIKGETEKYALALWWTRNFYPDLQTVANDLHAKGLLEAGKYVINIDW